MTRLPQTRSLRGAALALIIAFTATGCGGGGTSTADFAAKANPICQKHRGAIDKEASKLLAGGKLPGPKEFGRLAMGTIIPQTTAQLKELAAVEPSDEVKSAFKTYLKEGDKAVAKIKQDPSTLTDAANFADANAAADDAKLSKACRLGPS